MFERDGLGDLGIISAAEAARAAHAQAFIASQAAAQAGNPVDLRAKADALQKKANDAQTALDLKKQADLEASTAKQNEEIAAEQAAKIQAAKDQAIAEQAATAIAQADSAKKIAQAQADKIIAAKAKADAITNALKNIHVLSFSSIAPKPTSTSEPEYHDANGVVITKAQYDALMSGQPIYKDDKGNIITKTQYDDIMNNPTYIYYDSKGNVITKAQYDAAVAAVAASKSSKSSMTTDQMNLSITAMNDAQTSKIYYGNTPPYAAPAYYQWNHVGIGTRSEGFQLMRMVSTKA